MYRKYNVLERNLLGLVPVGHFLGDVEVAEITNSSLFRAEHLDQKLSELPEQKSLQLFNASFW